MYIGAGCPKLNLHCTNGIRYDMQCVYMKLWKDFKRAIFKLAGIAPHFGNEEQEDAMIDSLLKTEDHRGGGATC